MSGISLKRRTVPPLLTLLGGAAAFGLVVFHVSLLWRRLVDASIAEPAILGRWIAGALLIAGLFALRGHARHRLLVLWLLVAMLHAGIPAEQHHTQTSVPIAVVVQIGFAAMCGVLLAVLFESAAKTTFDSTALAEIGTVRASGFGFSSPSGRAPPAL